MKLKYIVTAALVAAISVTPLVVRAEMPSQLRACLAPNPLFTTPKQYREFAQVNDGRATYHYLHAIFNPSELPTTVALIKVQGDRCQNLDKTLTVFKDIRKYVPSKVADILTEKKWQSIRKMKGGNQLIQDIVNPEPDRNPGAGEMLSPIQVSALDRAALRRIGAYRR